MLRKLLLAALVVSGSTVMLAETGIAQMTQTNSREAQGRRICRYTDVTGKISLRRRVCMTKAEWDRTAEEQRKVGQEFVETLDSCATRGSGIPCD
jgi:hypothetical protein